MGMVANFIRLNAALLPALRANPSTIGDLLESDCKPTSGAAACMDIDKSWHLIHFFLTGRVGDAPPPLGDTILGGEELKGGDIGYVPPRVLAPSRVDAVARAIASIDPSTVPLRFDLAAVRTDVYLADTWTNSPDDRAYLVEYFVRLQHFYGDAARMRQFVIITIT